MATTLTINTTGLVGGTSPNSFVRVDLQNCSNARVIGSGQLVPQTVFLRPVNGVVTSTFFDNTQITCGTANFIPTTCGCNGSNKVSYYTFNFIYQGEITSIGSYNLKPGTFNLWDLQPCVGTDCISCNEVPTVNIITQTPLGAIDGVNNIFTLRFAPTVLWLQLNGVFLTRGIDYTLVGNVFAMNFAAPPVGSIFTAVYTYGPYVPDIVSEVPAGVIDGTNNVFTTSKPINLAAIWLYNNGVFQTQGPDYLVTNGNTITYTNPPPVGTGLYIEYISAIGGQTFSNISTEVPTGVIDGFNNTFHVSRIPSFVMVQQNQGLLQGNGVGYTQVGTNIIFTIPPTPGDVLLVTIFS